MKNEENMIDNSEVLMEVWKLVANYPNYEVSNFGQVRNCRTGRILRPSPMSKNKPYLKVVLCQNGERKNYTVHRLVAEAFIPNPAGLPQVNHINEVPTDNRAINLEWCDCKYNINYGTRTERMALTQGKPVEQYDLEDNYIRTWVSAREAERQTGISNSAINACCHGKKGWNTAGGFIWRFVEKID